MLFNTVLGLENMFPKDNIFQKIFPLGLIITGNERRTGKSHSPEQYFRVFWKCYELLIAFARKKGKDREP